MQNEPVELPAECVAGFLRTHWGIEPAAVRYAPVGRGSHHWIASDENGPAWFITADHLSGSRFAQLSASAWTARQLAGDGCDFVLAPVPDRTNTLVRLVNVEWAMQVLPYLPGWSTDQGTWADPDEQREIARIVGRVHATSPPVSVPRWDPTPPCRDQIEAALTCLDTPWPEGPYAEPTRAVLADNRALLEDLLHQYDTLTAAVELDNDPWVLTHGEPDSDNVIRTEDGRIVLIDWTSVAVAPRERDLYDVLQGPVDVLDAYQHTAGDHQPRPEAMRMIGLYWQLSHLGHDITRLRQSDGDNLTTAWDRLHKRLVPTPIHDTTN